MGFLRLLPASHFVLATTLCFTTISHAESLEDLLNSADSALGRKKESTTPSTTSSRPTAPKKQTRKAKPAAPSTATHSPATSTPPASTSIQPIENPDITRIVQLDVTQKRSEILSEKSYGGAALLAGTYTVGAGFRGEKDDDTYTVDKNAAVVGGMLQLTTPWLSFTHHTAPWGYGFGLSAGVFSGELPIARRGVIDEDRAYTYRIVPTDFFASLVHRPKSWMELQMRVGVGVDLYYQNGEEDADTFVNSAIGPVGAFSASVDVTKNFALVASAAQRGTKSTSNGQSLAGKTLALGTKMKLTY